MKMTVIMASLLQSFYNSSRSNREAKFIRAVKSFLNQTHPDKELIIIADGCDTTQRLYNEHFKNNPEVTLFKSMKLPTYAGGIRNAGLKLAKGDIITYLDNDDVIEKSHLKTIHDQFTDDVDWVYYDDYLVMNKNFSKLQRRHVELRYGQVGTSSISHRNFKKMGLKFEAWEGANGYGHDFIVVFKLNAMGFKYKKLETPPKYFVCHYGTGVPPGGGDY